MRITSKQKPAAGLMISIFTAGHFEWWPWWVYCNTNHITTCKGSHQTQNLVTSWLPVTSTNTLRNMSLCQEESPLKSIKLLKPLWNVLGTHGSLGGFLHVSQSLKHQPTLSAQCGDSCTQDFYHIPVALHTDLQVCLAMIPAESCPYCCG